MSNPYFRFKQFTVFHDKCAMKVGTDGVLLGSWADTTDCHKILDIGCGTGLISLMLAQRFPSAEIDAVEIDRNAYLQALENVGRSNWKDRINVLESDFLDWFGNKNKYDLIVSNPPYFSKSLLPSSSQRQLARHTDTGLTMDNLLVGAKMLLHDTGSISLILPYSSGKDLENSLAKCKLHLYRKTLVKPTPSSSPKRLLVEIKKESACCKTDELVIEEARHVYSHEYKQLTKDFYLDK